MTWNTGIPDLTNQISEDIPDIEENFETLPYINVWIPATAMVPLLSDGAEAGENEYVTNDVMFRYMAFDGGATSELVAFQIVMPENWDRGTIKAKFYWSSATDSTAGDTVEWWIAGNALSDSEVIDVSYGTAKVISDTLLANNGANMQITSATDAITIGGTPALGDLISVVIARNTTGTDDMVEDAWLFGVMLQLTRNEAVSGW